LKNARLLKLFSTKPLETKNCNTKALGISLFSRLYDEKVGFLAI
jgi:hypothetical protein